ncbi:MAG TPA: hypothetical protein VGG83_15975 [Trebonia sp.]|jgi:hypothetical protein
MASALSAPGGAAVTMRPAAIAFGADVLRRAFPDWRIAERPDYCFAHSEGICELDGPRSLLRCFLTASTLAGLAEKLCLQEHLNTLSDRELADVWDRISLPDLTVRTRP